MWHTNHDILQRPDFFILTSTSDQGAHTYRDWLLTSADANCGFCLLKIGRCSIKMKIPKSSSLEFNRDRGAHHLGPDQSQVCGMEGPRPTWVLSTRRWWSSSVFGSVQSATWAPPPSLQVLTSTRVGLRRPGPRLPQHS